GGVLLVEYRKPVARRQRRRRRETDRRKIAPVAQVDAVGDDVANRHRRPGLGCHGFLLSGARRVRRTAKATDSTAIGETQGPPLAPVRGHVTDEVGRVPEARQCIASDRDPPTLPHPSPLPKEAERELWRGHRFVTLSAPGRDGDEALRLAAAPFGFLQRPPLDLASAGTGKLVDEFDAARDLVGSHMAAG